MKLVGVYARFYRAFNYDYVAKSRLATEKKGQPRPEPRRWDLLDGKPFPYIRLSFDPSITCVVGPNESGKSQLLKIVECALFTRPLTFEDVCRYSPIYGVTSDPLPVPHVGVSVRVTTDQDVARLREIPGLNAVSKGDLLRIFRESATGAQIWLGDDATTPVLLEDTSALAESLPTPFRIHPERTLPDAVPLDFLSDEEAKSRIKPRPRAGVVLDAVARLGVFDKEGSEQIYQKIGQAVHVAVRDAGVDQPSVDQWQLARDLLVSCGGVVPAAFAELRREINAGKTGPSKGLQDGINDQLAMSLSLDDWWSQDEEFKLIVQIGDTDVKLLISDKTTRSYSFDERSGGLRHFLSYLVQYRTRLAEIESGEGDWILLMDEPDAYLSNTAQGDLLRLFQDFARDREHSDRYQVMFVTHSPFLIDKNRPERVRVLDKGTADLGTRVIDKTHHNHFEPIRTAFGAFVAETIFIGNCNLILEGPSDQIYIANSTAALVRAEAPITERLDLNDVTLVAAGSAQHVVYVTFLALGRDELEPAVVVLLDGDTDGVDAKEALLEGVDGAKKIPADRIVLLTDLAGLTSTRPGGLKDIEDLIPTALAAAACDEYAAVLGLAKPSLTGDQIQSHLNEDRGVFKATRAALREAGSDLRIDKVPFAQHVCALIEDDASRETLGEAVDVASANLVALVKRLSAVQRRTLREHQEAIRRRNVHTLVRQHLAENPGELKKDAIELLIEKIESRLDDSQEAAAIRLMARELLGEIEGLSPEQMKDGRADIVAKLEALPHAPQLVAKAMPQEDAEPAIADGRADPEASAAAEVIDVRAEEPAETDPETTESLDAAAEDGSSPAPVD
jgi:energy-coupling factor transporter ATP-binding protein EcfA2